MISPGRIFAVLMAGMLLLACRKKEDFPAIADGKLLQKDCAHLLAQPADGEIPRSQWPKSIQALKPLHVIKHQNDIQILTYQQPGKMVGGYYVYADPQFSPSTQGVWIQKTGTKGIYIFKRYN